MKIPFVDLKAQTAALRPELDRELAAVLDDCEFILGSRVRAFEAGFAAYCGRRFAVAVNSGTAALHLALLAHGIGPGDEVISVSHTFAATAAAILYTGATPVLVDIEPESLNLDPDRLEPALTRRTRAVLPVHLYGRPAAMEPIMDFARRHGLAVIEDACQAHGAGIGAVRVPVSGTGCFSFYPSKNLGACGEGGCLVTDSEEIAVRAVALRDHGQTEKYRHQYLGFNYRMPAFQGAVLKVKLPHLEAWTLARRENARRYLEGLAGLDLLRPEDPPGARHVFHLFVVRHPERDRLQARLAGQGIATGLHYPIPVHLQPAFAGRVRPAGSLAVTEAAARQVLSLPMYPELTAEQVDFVCASIRTALSGDG